MSRTTSSDDDEAPHPQPQSVGVFTRSGSGGSRVAAPVSAAFSDEMAQLMQAEQRLTHAVAEQTRLMQALETRMAAPGGDGDGGKVAALESRVLQVLAAMDKRLKAAEARAEAAEGAARRAAADTQALAAQVAELRTAASATQHAPPHAQPASAAAPAGGAQDQWSSNPFFDTAPHSAPPARAAPFAAPPSYSTTSHDALPPAPHTVGPVGGASTRAQAAAAEQAAMDVINLINKPHTQPVPYMVGNDPSPAAARAAAALAQARARMRSREGGAAAPASSSAPVPFEDGLSSVTRARQLLDSIGAESGGAARRAPAGPVAGLLAQAGGDDLT